MNLDLGETFIMEENVTNCGEYEWMGTIYSQSGDYQEEIQNPEGCDSLFVLHLTVGELVHYEFEQQSCGSYSWNGETYGVSGDYERVFTTASGCDSVVIMHLNISDSYAVETDTVSCGAYLWQGQVLVESGDYQIMFQTNNGCDSLVVLHLTVGDGASAAIEGMTSIYPATNLVVGVYTYHIDSTNIDPSTVRWSIDRDDWILLPHRASCDLVCGSAGTATLRAWTEGESCNVDTTLVIFARFHDVEDNASDVVRVYPNPTKGTLTIEAEGIESIRLMDMMGQVLEMNEYGRVNTATLHLGGYAPSVYLLEIKTMNGFLRKQIVLMR